MSNGRIRRGSIFSGVILILIGALLLYHEFHPSFAIYELFRRWWPLLIIFWGLAKLYDRFAAQRSGDTRAGMVSGGEVFLVLFLLFLLGGVGVVDWVHHNPNEFGWDNDIPFITGTPYTITEEVPVKAVPANARIAIETGRGDISVHPENAAEIRVVVKKTAHADSESQAQSTAGEVHVVVTDNGDGSFAVRPQGQAAHGNIVDVSLEVHVPKQASVTAESSHGNIDVNSLQGNVTVESHNGDVNIRDAGGDVSVDQQHGDVHVVGAAGNVKLSGRGSEVEVSDIKGQAAIEGEFYGPIRVARVAKGARFISQRTDLTITQLNGRFETGSGQLTVTDANGDLTLSTSKNDVSLENVSGRIQVDNRGGDVEARFTQAPHDPISISTTSGDITLTLPDKSSFQIDAQTQNGDVYSEFSGISTNGSERGDNRSLSGQVGSRGPQIHLRMTHGDIRIHKAG